jgi:hypothetical protein
MFDHIVESLQDYFSPLQRKGNAAATAAPTPGNAGSEQAMGGACLEIRVGCALLVSMGYPLSREDRFREGTAHPANDLPSRWHAL